MGEFIVGATLRADDISQRGPRSARTRFAAAAVTAEMDHRRLEFAQLAEEVQRLSGPPRNQLEPFPVAAPLKLCLDRSRFLVEREPISSEGIGGQE
jgi:hypothetical protein